MRGLQKFLLGAAGLVLLFAYAAMTMELWQGKTSRKLSPSLAERFPAEVPGVAVQDLPLGPNEFVDAIAKEKMEYDDVINRAYTDAFGTFQVYIGYWAGGKRSPSHIAAHTPDRCWTLAGMHCEESNYNYPLKTGEGSILGGQWRRFRDPNENIIYVAYWHKVGYELYDYGNTFHDYTPPLVRVKKVVRDLFVWRKEQYFIRVTATRPLEDFAKDPVFASVMQRVEALGLRSVPF